MTMPTSTYTPSNTVFLRALQGPVSQGEHLWVCSFADDPSVEEPVRRWFGRPLAAAAVVELSSRRNNYFSTAILKDGRRKRASFVRLMVLVADDADQTKLKAPPTWVLRTSRHKVQVGFAIRADDVDAFCWDTVGRALKAMHEKGLVGADKSGNNAARYVRLPVGSNTKAAYGEPFAHELIEWRPESVFTVAEALQALGVDPVVLAEPRRPAASVLDHLPSGITDELRDAVMRLDPDMGRDDWLHVGMALHHESGGDWDALALWDQWSAKGSKYKSAEDLEIRWDSFGRYTGKPRTGASVLQMARALPLTAEDFEVEAPSMLDDSEEPATGAGGLVQDDGAMFDIQDDGALFDIQDDGAMFDIQDDGAMFDIQDAEEFVRGRPLTWIIKKVLPQAVVGVIYGESTAGKTFFTLDMVLAVARGLPEWRGHKIKQADVLYVAAEGAFGVRKRLLAHAQHHGYPVSDLKGLKCLAAAPNLLDKEKVRGFIESVRLRCSGNTGLIVVDTLAQSTPGANENSSEDMGLALDHCKTISTVTGAMVLLVAHSGKDAGRGVRGWSGIKGALDFEMVVTNDDGHRVSTVSKLKDGAAGEQFPFALESVVLGVDEDGEDDTSAVVVDTVRSAAGAGLPPVQAAVMDYLSASLMGDEDRISMVALVPGVAARLAEYQVQNGRTVQPGKTRNKAVKDAVEALCKAGRLSKQGEEICKLA